MGVADQFARANELLASKLAFKVEGEATTFRLALDRAGIKRFGLVVQILEMWQRPHNTGAQKYDRLMRLLALVTPDKAPGTKYRSPAVAAAHEAQDALKAELSDVLRREP